MRNGLESAAASFIPPRFPSERPGRSSRRLARVFRGASLRAACILNGQVYGSDAVTLSRSEVRYPAQAENPTSTVDAPPIPCTVLTMNPLAVTEETTSSGEEDRTTGW